MDETEGQRAGHEEGPSRTEQRLVAMKEKGAVEQFLGIYGNEWVRHHYECPEPGRAFDEREQKVGRELTNGQTEQDEENRIAENELGEIGGNIPQRDNPGQIEGRIVTQSKKREKSGKEQVWNREVRKNAVENEQWNPKEEQNKLGCEKKQVQHKRRQRNVSGTGLFIDDERPRGWILPQRIAQAVDGRLCSVNLVLNSLSVSAILRCQGGKVHQ